MQQASPDVAQRVREKQRSTERMIEDLRARIAEHEQELQDMRLFLTMYDHYAAMDQPGQDSAAGESDEPVRLVPAALRGQDDHHNGHG